MNSECRLIREPLHATAAGLLASLSIVWLALAGGLARLGFSHNDPAALVRAAGIGCFLIHFPSLVRLLCFRRGREPGGSWLAGDAPLLLVGWMLVALAGFVLGDTGRWAGVVLASIGGAQFLVCLVRWVAGARLRQTVGLLALSLLFALYIAAAGWGSGYHNPLFVEAMAAGESNIDTLFHASICQMIRTYGVPSTGLDGTPLLHYHFGSHWVFAQLSRLLGMTVIDFYNLGFEIIVVPFCLYSLVVFAAAFGAGRQPSGSDAGDSPQTSLHMDKLFWFVLCVGFMGWLPMTADVPASLSRNALIVSESYGLSLAAALLTAAAFIDFSRNAAPATASLPSTGAALLFFPLSAAAIGFLKLSVMIVAVAAFVYTIVRLGLVRKRTWLVLALFVVLASAATAGMAAGERFSAEAGWFPFGFLRWNVPPVWWPYFALVYYVWVWIYAALRLAGCGTRTLADASTLIRQRQAVDLELLAVIALVGSLPGLLLTGDSSAHYFSDCQRWAALGLVLGVIASGCPFNRADEPGPHSGAVPLWRMAGLLIAVCVAATLVANTLSLLNRAATANLAARGYPAGGSGLGTSLMRGDLAAARRILEQSAAETEARIDRERLLLRQLQQLGRMPLADKRDTLLYIPKSNRRYWDLLHGPHWPANVPFVAPALTGLALIEGLHEPDQGNPVRGYGYHSYADRTPTRRPPPVGQHRSELCRRAAALGFRRIIVLAPEDDGGLDAQTWQCDPPDTPPSD